MLGKLLASPLLTFNPTASFCPFSQHDLAGTAAASTPGHVKSSYIVPVNHISDTRFCISTSKKWKLHSTAQIDNQVLNDEEKKMWDSCRQALSSFKFSVEEEDKILGKAFGYIHTPYWYEERKKEVPQFETVNEILDYLRSLNLTDDDLCKVLKKFPEVLGCSLEDELKNNVQVLSKQWGIEGKTLRNLLLRNPKVLGYNVDCKGDCEAKCTRCWARF
ncbi:PREDICTED: uncharacterized protein LOC109172875 isoform X1 [Ipomoea nil]|uniref:uncharacterized protein LOC109172875 isoform X1 n=1 Tax=Ipomoea nil TaxID=35883 RepID=UPI000900F8F8|nr:PREDICTED: uncharacterized protein LOC109172875 isoform X1 [Ipomoea nil]XP_019177659.1 PREDICTED: uncharacterized protein LOC109172875 isoform X1 [Ipomoea nil]XP_019177660.1 PREDICTED: uncharacterized protein LOC109172875 isoform X1 [Ipomoea nil]